MFSPYWQPQPKSTYIYIGAIPIYLTHETYRTVKSVFSYLTEPPNYLDEVNQILERRIAFLQFHPMPDFHDFNICGLNIQSFPVYHGGKYVSLGFTIGQSGEFVYISDVKIIPEDTWKYLKNLPRIQVLVVDALDWDGIWSHCGMHEAIDIAKQLNPQKVYFTGMSCGMGLHDDIEKKLKDDLLLTNYYVAYDGLVLDFRN